MKFVPTAAVLVHLVTATALIWSGVYCENPSGNVTLHIGTIIPINGISLQTHSCTYDSSSDYAYRTILQEAHNFSIFTANQILAPIGIQFQPSVLDYCNQDEVVYKNVICLMKTFKTGICNSLESAKNGDLLLSTVASTNSDTAKVVSIMFGQECTPVIAPMATNPELDKYPYFVRSMPSDYYQTKVIVDLVRANGWTPVIIIYETSLFGSALVRLFRDHAGRSNVCIAQAIAVSSTVSYEERDEQWPNVFWQVFQEAPAAILVFMNFPMANEFFDKVQQLRPGLFSRFVFIGPDGWAGKHFGSSSLPQYSITVQPYVGENTDFDTFIETISIDRILRQNRTDNLAKMIANQQNCSLDADETGLSSCTGTEKLKNWPPGAITRAPFIINPIRRLAESLRKFHKLYCGNMKASKCPGLWEHLNGSVLVDDLRVFEQSEPTYGVFQFVNDTWLLHGTYDPTRPQSYNVQNLLLTEQVLSTVRNVRTNCYPVCGIRQVLKNSSCCYSCENCSDFEFVPALRSHCTECSWGFMPSNEGRWCIRAYHTTVFSQGRLIAATVFCVTGMLLLSLCSTFLIRYRNAGILHLSCSETSWTILVATTVYFLTTLMCTFSITEKICAVVWVLFGAADTLTAAAHLIRIITYFAAPRMFRSPDTLPQSCSFASSFSQNRYVRLGLLILLLISQALISTVVKVHEQSRKFQPRGDMQFMEDRWVVRDKVPPGYWATCQWDWTVSAVYLTLPFVISIGSGMLCFKLTGVTIRLVRLEAKIVLMVTLFRLFVTSLMLPITAFGAYAISRKEIMIFFVVHCLINGYVLMASQLLPMVVRQSFIRTRFPTLGFVPVQRKFGVSGRPVPKFSTGTNNSEFIAVCPLCSQWLPRDPTI